MADPIPHLLSQLATYLKSSVSGIKEILEEYPTANQKLDFPCISMMQGTPVFESETPYPLPGQTLTPDVNNKLLYKVVTGHYDFTLVLDLWARNKVERDKFKGLLMEALNPNVRVGGLNLKLPTYHNTWATLSAAGVPISDTEESAQRQEWRVKVNLLVHCKYVRETSDYAMITIENQISTPDTIPSS